jgi:HD-GYP domain-containing protein (c-di-GMP phosphodiesterase class II)
MHPIHVTLHAEAGYQILKDIDFPWPIADMVRQHHERIDGTGCPLGLKGEEIVLEGRILAVADVVEAMSSHRPYRPGLGVEAALKEISNHKGDQFDQAVVEACIRLFKEN